MDEKYYIWFGVAFCGVIAGMFVKPGSVVKACSALFALAILGLVCSAALSQESLVWLFGLSAMAIPILGGIATLGSCVGAFLRRILVRKIQK
jgi:hypothetical protein